MFNLTTMTFVMSIVGMPPLSLAANQFAFPVLLCSGASPPPGWRPSLFKQERSKRYPPVVLSYFQRRDFPRAFNAK